MRDLEVTREFTEQQEYDRIVAALIAALGAQALSALMNDGARLKDDRAAELGIAAAVTTTEPALA